VRDGDEEARELPFPPQMGALLALGGPGNPSSSNRSLLFDKGLRWKSGSWTLGAAEKEGFLREFSAAFPIVDADHYSSFLARREAALLDLGVRPISFTTQTRLVIGLGLPSPLETGFLLDRLTGCPYLPGSSVKGMLRAAARLVRQEELVGEKTFWDSHFERIFGPEIAPGANPKTGSAIFYDALPVRWPNLEVDVLTPHYGKYYREGAIPGDWDNPIPVPFLTIKAGTTFHFYIQAAGPDGESLKRLLDTALDWLGIGAKKSSGYGVFGANPPPEAETVSTAQPSRSHSARPPEPPQPRPQSASVEISWDNIELSMRQSTVFARKGKQTAECPRGDLDREAVDALIRLKTLRADVIVLKAPSGEYRLVKVTAWRVPSR
jgi:CRISPR type III-B/RAMP module RAMP protein Cmr6